jgi:glutamate-ammonia-ligase adenylyltransferase
MKVQHTVVSLLAARPLAKPAAQKLLREHGFRDAQNVFAALERLRAEPLQRRALGKVFPRLMRACQQSADPDRAFVNFERLVEVLPNPVMFYHYLEAAPDRVELLVKLFAHSQALADTLMRNATYFHFLIAPATLEKPREKAWLEAELKRLLMPIRQPHLKMDVVRRFRRRETLRIGARDLTGSATVEETTLELSNLADVCLQAVLEIATERLRAQYKTSANEFAVIGMGKLGGQELNYSSDVDVIFVYREDGELTPTLTRHEFYTKLAEEIIRGVGASSEEGNVFRIDLRLRPEGSAGPLVCSLANSENYYAERGETWERMSLIKARPVAGNAGVGAEFIAMVQPFVYAKHAGENVVREMAAIKQRIENEIVREDRLTRHVKLGIGGIREIEFIVQSFQVLRGARVPVLRERCTLKALPVLVKLKMLTETEARTLAEAYRFLRNVEHRLQMEMELQTHTIPDEEQALYRLARSLGFESVEKFFTAHGRHTAAVRKIYEGVLANAEQRPSEVWTTEKLEAALRGAGFSDAPAALKTVESLQQGSGFAHVSERTKQLSAALLPVLLKVARELADPDGALMRFEKFVNAYGARGLLYEILVRHEKLVSLLMKLGDASRMFSETLAKQPELFDEVCRGAALSEPKEPSRMREELEELAKGLPAADAAREWLRAELLRVGIEDVMGLVPVEHVHAELTRVAEACLQFALEQTRRELKSDKLPFAIIGLGKFGAMELGYGADLDVVFVGGRGASDQERAIRVANGVLKFMANLFVVDARLRPDGAAGPMASSLAAHEEYYRHRAQLWERQALIKARVVAGDAEFGEKFIKMVHGVVFERGLTTTELEEIRRMRHRMETERGDQRHVELEFKTGPGGLVDVEFLIQAMQLQHGHAHPQLRTAHTLAALNRLTALGLVEDRASFQLREGYLFLRKVESALRRDEGKAVSHLPVEAREQMLLAKRLGFGDAEKFLEAYRQVTRQVRGWYERYMSEQTGSGC